MFLYRFVCRRRRSRPQSCSRHNFWTTFWISLNFGTIVCSDLKITRLDFCQFSSWPWPWIFKLKYGIYYISAKNGLIATKRKANIWIGLWASNVTIGFDPGHDLDVEFSRSNMEFAISHLKVVWRSGVRIYQIVTGVTSDVGVQSTHLVVSDNGLWPGCRQAIIWTHDGILLIGPLGTNFSEVLLRNVTFWFKKMHLKMSSVNGRSFCLGLNVLIKIWLFYIFYILS